MRCEDAKTHFADHLGRALPASTAEEVDEHLRTCGPCADEFNAIDSTWQQLGLIPGPPADSAAMRRRFQATLEEYKQGVDRLVGVRARTKQYGLQFVAAAALVVFGVLIGRESVPVPAQDAGIAEMRAELRDMREMVTLSLLQQQSASERLKGITWTSQIEQPGNDVTAALLDTLMHDPNVNVRLASVDALKRLAERETVRRGAIEALPQERSPLVQIALIDFVIEVNGREAAEVLRQLAGDPMLDEAVRARVARGLAQLG